MSHPFPALASAGMKQAAQPRPWATPNVATSISTDDARDDARSPAGMRITPAAAVGTGPQRATAWPTRRQPPQNDESMEDPTRAAFVGDASGQCSRMAR